jgi:hypothetical protein
MLAFTASGSTFADDDSVEFDVPAFVGVREILPLPIYGPELPSSFSAPSEEKTIELLLPISSVIGASDRGDVKEFRFDVSWVRSVYPILDYGPKTQTVSDVEGLLNIEENRERSSKAGFNFTAKPLEIGNGSLTADVGGRKSERLSFQRIPQHEVLVASGTIDRGTGAFFRFHASKTETLEGSRNLLLAYRVPQSWRNGLLKVECRATGKRRVGFWDEPIDFGRSFVVPLFIEGDSVGQQMAIDFVRAEQDLRKSWNEFEAELKKSRGPFSIKLFGGENKLPKDWPHLLIQSGDDQYLSRYQNFLSKDLAVTAGRFVQARSSLK